MDLKDNESLDNIQQNEKKSKKKVVILVIIGLLIAALATVLVLALINRDSGGSNKNKKTDPVEPQPQTKTLTKEEYQARVDAYGELVKDTIFKFYDENKRYPDATEIVDLVNVDDMHCSVQINKDLGFFMVSSCFINGYEYKDLSYIYRSSDINNLKSYDVTKLNTMNFYGLHYGYTNMDSFKVTSEKKALFNEDDEVYPTLGYTLNNKKLTIFNNDGRYDKKYELNNVEKGYFEYYECGGRLALVLFVGDNIVYGSMNLNNEELSFDEYNKISSKSINDIYSIYISSASCDAKIDYVGKNDSGEYIDLSTGKQYVENKYRTYTTNDDEAKYFGNADTVMKIKAGFYNPLDDFYTYVVDENDYLYRIDSKNEIVKYNDLKVLEITEDEHFNYIVKFSDNSSITIDEFIVIDD